MNKFWISFVSSYPPRECGIATFTKDLTDAIDAKFRPSLTSKIVAINKDQENYDYSKKVILKIREDDPYSYSVSAKKINSIKKIKLVNIQHEFGIYGGEWGEYLINFLENIDKPVVTTLHTILPNPEKKVRSILKKISKFSSHLIIMNRIGLDILKNDYNIKNNIVVIPHGTPTVPLNGNKILKRKLGFEDKILLSSFGMLNPGKGYEFIIESLTDIVKKFPNILFLIIGETHPEIKKRYGEKYRNFLKKRVNDLKLNNHVKFINKYISLEAIINYLRATDIYISSNQDPRQIVSGTLAYAASCGKAIISTPYLHAKDLLSNNRGILVKFRDSSSIAESVIGLLSNSELKKQIEKRIYNYTRNSTWPNVAISHYKLFKKIDPDLSKCQYAIPDIQFDHLEKLTDKFGIIQFSKYTIPWKTSGYTLDDNARALVATAMHYDFFQEQDMLEKIELYLNFIEYVYRDLRFYNFVDINKQIDYKHWSEDAHGRALWALGYILSIKSIPKYLRVKAQSLFKKGKKIIKDFKSSRSVAFSLIGLYYYNQIAEEEGELLKKLADYLISLYYRDSDVSWNWFEDFLTYSNSKLPESLFYCYDLTNDKKYLEVAEQSLKFLIKHTFVNGFYAPIGQNKWFYKNSTRSLFDQQPVDTATMVQTLVVAYQVTKKYEYYKYAIKAFEWFLGKNYLNQVVYDSKSKGCQDGLRKYSINLNQGAESTIMYLIARLTIKSLKEEINFITV
ncbi:MAG: glycosyltransferase [Promethearchaeota archaeon]